MCIFIAFHRWFEDFPIVIGANRDEFYDRPSEGPQLLGTEPRVWGGRDVRAGGTWLGVNEYGLLAALTNRSRGAGDPTASSRGGLCRRVLDSVNVATAKEAVQSLFSGNRYNPFNLYIADGSDAWVAEGEAGSVEFTRCEPGPTVVGNTIPNDLNDSRVARALELIRAEARTTSEEALSLLERILADHQGGVGSQESICVHGSRAGTVSSSILVIRPSRIEESVYRHLEGKPCVEVYRDYSSLFSRGRS